ncbi:MAG: Holliday junction resolvase RuvX [Alphaproteobacteria bacterium]
MPIIEPLNFKKLLIKDKRVLGLDLGSKTIGLAISDSNLVVSSPLITIHRKKFTIDAEILITLINERMVGGLVLGLPVNMDGSEGPRAQSTRQFAQNLIEKIDIPIVFWDERLSSAEVERILINEIDMSRKRREQVIDKMAAGVILQGFLDYLNHS